MLPLNLIAQDHNLWNSIDSLDVERAKSLFSDKDINTIVGIWEAHNGVIFMIKDCYDKDGVVNYQMIMLKDRVYYGDWHIKIKYGNVIGLLSNTADKNVFSCKFKRKENDVLKIFHLSLRGNKLVYTGSSNLKRKLFAIKQSPIPSEKEIIQTPPTPLTKNKIEKQTSK